jgi:hypothetical protein
MNIWESSISSKKLFNEFIKPNKDMRFEVTTAVKMAMFLFWVVTPHGRVGRYKGFGETALKTEAVCSSKTMVSTYKSERRYYPEEKHRHK